jgi:hypothetical protein
VGPQSRDAHAWISDHPATSRHGFRPSGAYHSSHHPGTGCGSPGWPGLTLQCGGGRERMNDECLTDELVCRILGWRLAPNRYVKSERTWTPRWKFAPLRNLEHAFALLDRAKGVYTLTTSNGKGFEAEVHVGGRTGKAVGEPKARAITIALARALGLEVERCQPSRAEVGQR